MEHSSGMAITSALANSQNCLKKTLEYYPGLALLLHLVPWLTSELPPLRTVSPMPRVVLASPSGLATTPFPMIPLGSAGSLAIFVVSLPAGTPFFWLCLISSRLTICTNGATGGSGGVQVIRMTPKIPSGPRTLIIGGGVMPLGPSASTITVVGSLFFIPSERILMSLLSGLKSASKTGSPLSSSLHPKEIS